MKEGSYLTEIIVITIKAIFFEGVNLIRCMFGFHNYVESENIYIETCKNCGAKKCIDPK